MLGNVSQPSGFSVIKILGDQKIEYLQVSICGCPTVKLVHSCLCQGGHMAELVILVGHFRFISKVNVY